MRKKIKSIIFGTDTQTGKLFDEVLIVAIILSIVTVLLDSVSEYNENYGTYLYISEWVFTILFSIKKSDFFDFHRAIVLDVLNENLLEKTRLVYNTHEDFFYRQINVEDLPY